jgi:prepilin-type N-terminal cleavage/methylation domain-containing protein
MSHSHLSPSGRLSRRGLSLLEVMISLAITSMLLTAIAAAFQSSASVIEVNDRFFRATQSGRVALNQMCTEIRRCDSIDDSKITANLLPILRPPETRPANEALRYYKYDAANKRLVIYFERTNGTFSQEYPLAEEVQSSPFSWDMGKDANNTDCVARVSIVINVQVGVNNVRLSGSAAPRRSLSYK